MWQLVFNTLFLNRCFGGKKGQSVLVCSTSQLVSRIIRPPHDNYEHAGGLRGFWTDRETVYRNCLPLCTMGRKTWRHEDPHAQNYAVCSDDLARINMIYMHRVKWSTVRLTKWPSAIAIRFVITLHSLSIGWLQGQGAHIMTVSWFRVIMTRFWHEVTIITTSCYLPRFSYNTIAFYGPHRSCYKGVLLYIYVCHRDSMS